MTDISDFIDNDALTALIQSARAEDLGAEQLDVTSACFIDKQAEATAHFVPREPGVVAGLNTLATICSAYGGRVLPALKASDGDMSTARQSVATITGPLRDVLAIERVALNLMAHLSGIASLTAQYVAQCEGTKAKVYDTRKTLPGLRSLQKYAVACGGGGTHRMGLHDAALVKDNHLAGVALNDLSDRLTTAKAEALRLNPSLKFFQVEVDNFEQLEQVLKAPVDIVLLDNMPPPQLLKAVALRDVHAPDVELEASGGVGLDTVGPIAKTGVDRISVGALTHSANSLDIGLDIGLDIR